MSYSPRSCFQLATASKSCAHVNVALVDRRPVGEGELLALHVDGRPWHELQAASVVVVQVRLDDVTDALGLDAE